MSNFQKLSNIFVTQKMNDAINGEMFGDIYTTFTTTYNYFEENAEYRLGAIRWPGGSLAETKGSTRHSYSLTHDELFASDVKDVTDRNFSTMLEHAIDHDSNFATILPTYTYFNSASTTSSSQQKAALESYRNDLDLFFDRLEKEDGHYDVVSDFFDLGHELILEIGNETSHLGWSAGRYSYDWNYGTLAYEALKTTSDQKSIQNEDVKIAVQMGVNVGGAEKIIQELDGRESGKDNVLKDVDMLVSHNALVYSADDFDFAKEYEIIKAWQDAFENDGDFETNFTDVQLYQSAWSVGNHNFGANLLNADLSLKSADDFNTNQQAAKLDAYYEEASKIAEQDNGARQGAGTLDVYSKLIALGYDNAALWGTVDPRLHSNSYQNYSLEGNWFGVGGENNFSLSHGGEVLRSLSEATVGKYLLTGGAVASQSDPKKWNATYYNHETGAGAGAVNTYYFAGENDYTIFSSVTDIDGQNSTYEGSKFVTYDLSTFGDIQTVTVEKISTEFDTAAWRQFKDNSQDNDFFELYDNDIQEFRRLFELPKVETYEIDLDSPSFTYEFTTDFEVVRFDFSGNDLDLDEALSDRMISKTDVVHGTSSSEKIIGDFGHDYLIGNGGNDSFDGGKGIDRIFLDEGEDEIIFKKNTDLDIVYSFENNRDKIRLEDDIAFADLSIREHRDESVIISLDDQYMILNNIDIGLIDESDFIF